MSGTTARRLPTSPRRLLGPISAFSGAHRTATVIVGMALFSVIIFVGSAFPPLSYFQQQNAWLGAFVNAGVFVLLAMGLNVVIGMAGLLDLGYAAFFAIGAYAYAYSNSPFSGTDLPFIPMGEYWQTTAYRKELSGIIPGCFTVFWGVRRA